MAQKIVVLFNLNPSVDAAVYENWARSTDLPTVNSLASVEAFRVFKVPGLLGGGAAPYQYVEIIDCTSLEALGGDISTETMQRVAAEFQQFADNPLFMLTTPLAD